MDNGAFTIWQHDQDTKQGLRSDPCLIPQDFRARLHAQIEIANLIPTSQVTLILCDFIGQPKRSLAAYLDTFDYFQVQTGRSH
ncbi:MAG: hypothetical protein ACFFCZ_15955 [Promethearchaeota archaeon]